MHPRAGLQPPLESMPMTTPEPVSPLSRTRIKFCGITRIEDALAAARLGADAVGLIFTARSPRRIDLDAALAIRDALPPLVAVVALFMDQDPAEVRRVVDTLRPHAAQFHGGEDDATAAACGAPYLKTIPMAEPHALDEAVARYPRASGFVLDGHRAGEPGGRGRAFDWHAVRAVGRPLVLAGGLDAGNVGRAIGVVRPWAVDVSSGIERSPGIKDHERMQAFVDAVRRADGIG